MRKCLHCGSPDVAPPPPLDVEKEIERVAARLAIDGYREDDAAEVYATARRAARYALRLRAEREGREVEELRALSHARAQTIASLRSEAEQLRETMGRLVEWTHEFGSALCPRKADTYGEGVRDAKAAVARIIDRAALAGPAGGGEG